MSYKRPPSYGEKPPCLTCEKSGCGAYHDLCEVYQAWHQRREALRQAMRRDKGNADAAPPQFGEA